MIPLGRAITPKLLCLLAAIAVLPACDKLPGRSGVDEESEDKPDYRTVEVRSGDFQVSVSAMGKVVPISEVQVGSKASGEIVTLPFEEGDYVKKGELLVRLDPKDEKRNVARSESLLRSQKARLAKSRSELNIARSNAQKAKADAAAAVTSSRAKLGELKAKHDRMKELFKRELVSTEDLEIASTAHEQAMADLLRAEATLEDTKSLEFQIAAREQDIVLAEVEVNNADIQLDEVRQRLEETEIIAPMDGVITTQSIELGQVISSAISNVGGGTVLMMLSDLSTLYLVTSVDETDIGGIELGQRAVIRTDAYPEDEFEGKVAHIAPVGVEVASVVTFDVKVEVVGEGLKKLRPGMTADVTIVQGESLETLWVQSEAIQGEPPDTFVEVLDSEEAAPRRVDIQTGLTDGIRTEVIGALRSGDDIILPERTDLSPWERGEEKKEEKRRIRAPFLKKKDDKKDDKKDKKSDEKGDKKEVEKESE